jgi:hypothetical protein
VDPVGLVHDYALITMTGKKYCRSLCDVVSCTVYLQGRKLAREEQERAIHHAMQAYTAELLKSDAERKPLKTLCREVAEKWRENGKPVVESRHSPETLGWWQNPLSV